MAQAHNHYEAAFEDFVRARAWPYVSVNEHRKAILSGGRIKSFDFLLYRPQSKVWLVEVKGRKFPYLGPAGSRYWENWVTDEDLQDLARWNDVFGSGFEAVLVFAYWIKARERKAPPTQLHLFRGEYYAFLWIPAREYEFASRNRSRKWKTVSLATADFKRLARPLALT
ncbi:MAG: HYExAFE family protein [Planctomycetota bacterium]|jgi:hypothetical protein